MDEKIRSENDKEDSIEICQGDEENNQSQWKSKEREIFTSTIEYSLPSLADLITRKKINLVPSYQRRYRWDTKRQSKLIESFIIRVPIPPIYLNEDRKGNFSVIDGKQRLNTIADFFAGKLKLEGLEVFEDLNEMKINDLPPEIYDDLSSVPTLRAIILLRQSRDDLKFEVFRRLNTGGVNLNDQEIRNSAYPGSLNNLLLELSEHKRFQRLLGIQDVSKSNIYQEMGDVELVLRYLTFRITWDKFSGKIKDSMTNFMRDCQYIDSDKISEFRDDFLNTIESVDACFGDFAFRRWQPEKGNWRNQPNASLYDAEMFAFKDTDAKKIGSKREEILDEFKLLFDKKDFQRAIYSGTNAKSSFTSRITAVKGILNSVLGGAYGD